MMEMMNTVCPERKLPVVIASATRGRGDDGDAVEVGGLANVVGLRQ